MISMCIIITDHGYDICCSCIRDAYWIGSEGQQHIASHLMDIYKWVENVLCEYTIHCIMNVVKARELLYSTSGLRLLESF